MKLTIKENTYRYRTTHGLQPGTVPKGVEISDIDDDVHGTFFSLDRELTKDEMDFYGIHYADEPSYWVWAAKIDTDELDYSSLEDILSDQIDNNVHEKSNASVKKFRTEEEARKFFEKYANRPQSAARGTAVVPVLLAYNNSGDFEVLDYGQINLR